MCRLLGSTATPASSGFPATTGRSASECRNWYSTPPVSAVGALPLAARASQPRLLYRRSPSHVPCKSRRPGSRRLYAGHHLARNAGTRQALPEGRSRTPGFDAISDFRRLNDDARPGSPRPSASGTSSWSPPDAIKPRLFPGRSPRQSSANAAPGRFDAYPRRADARGPTILHLSHSTAYEDAFLHRSSFSVRDAHSSSFGGESGAPRA